MLCIYWVQSHSWIHTACLVEVRMCIVIHEGLLVMQVHAVLLLYLQEKDSSLPEDYGKDLATVQALQRRHEGFEVCLRPLSTEHQNLVYRIN